MSSRPKTAVIEGRADIRSIATLARYFIEQDNSPRSKSELVRFIIETFTDILVENNIVTRFQSSQQAKEYLSKISMSYGRNDKLSNSLINQIQKETLQDEGFNPSNPTMSPTDEAAQEAARLFTKDNPELSRKEKEGIAGPTPIPEDNESR